MIRPLVVLGATGSIGRQTLQVARRLEIPVVGLAAGSPSPKFQEIARAWPDAPVAIAGGDPAAWPGTAAFGSEAVAELAGRNGCTVVNGIVGAAGLEASVTALRAGNRLALANKESMVAGGDVVNVALQEGGGELIPVDSEHSALFQCLVGESIESVTRLILTASGGPFFGRSSQDLASVTAAEALDHPTWNMGPRVTVDSATLMNKGLEVIEAHFLFGVDYERIDVVVHRQSIVHSVVEFVDGSSKAQLGDPDMRVPIQYAVTYPHRRPGVLPPFAFGGRTLDFSEPDRASFPALDLAFEAGRSGGSAPAVLNAADEVAVQAFLEGRLGFPGIVRVVEQTLAAVPVTPLSTVEDVLAVDAEARRVALTMIS